MEFNGTFLVTIISFLVFVFLMNKILYKPMSKIVAQRKEFVDGNLLAAENNHKEAQEISAQREERLSGAKNDAREQYIKSIADFKTQKNEMVQKAQWFAGENLATAYKELDKVSNETKEALKGKMSELANDIVEKVLGYRSEVESFDKGAVDKILYQ